VAQGTVDYIAHFSARCYLLTYLLTYLHFCDRDRDPAVSSKDVHHHYHRRRQTCTTAPSFMVRKHDSEARFAGLCEEMKKKG